MIPDMHLFGKTVSAYMLFAVAGVLTAVFFLYKFAKKQGKDEVDAMSMLLFCFVGVFFGGHLFYGLTNFSSILALLRNPGQIRSLQDFVYWFASVFGGSVFYGGLTGAILCAYIYTGKKALRRERRAYMDLATLAIPLFHFFGRLGCFCSGCCYGIECHFGVTYHYSLAPGANGVTRFPVQLAEALCNALIFVLLLYLYQRGRNRGQMLYLYLLLYTPVRFMLEFLRGDAIRGHLGALSTSQWISLLYGSVAAVCLFISKRKVKNSIAPAAGDGSAVEA